MSPREIPGLHEALLRSVVWSEDRAHLIADLREEFARLANERGDRAAGRWYRAQVRASLIPLLLRRLGRARNRRRGSTFAKKRRGSMGAIARGGQDLRQAARSVLRSPRYAATVIVTFALASGANIAVFSVVNSVYLKPLPYPAPEDLVMVHRITDDSEEAGVSWPDLSDWRDQVRAFDGWAGYSGSSQIFLGPSGAEAWRGIESSPDLFEVLGVQPMLGRGLRSSDQIGDRVVVLSNELWARSFGSDPDIVGRSIRLETGPATVVGVMGTDFYFPTPEEGFWMPLEEDSFLDRRGAWFLQTLARLAPGVSPEAAEAEAQTVAVRVAEEAEGVSEGTRVRLETRHEAYVGDTRTLFGILMGTVGVVLLIACANIANLALTRATVRERELAVRSALGAGRLRIGRQLVAEHVLLAVAGAVSGLALSLAVVAGLVALGPAELPRLGEIRVDLTALGYAMVIAVVSGVLFGAAPALSVGRSKLFPALKDAGRRSLGLAGLRSLGALVIAQVSLAVVLVLGASLLVSSFLRLSAVRPGFDMDRVVAVRVDLPGNRYETTEAVEGFYREVGSRLRGRAGIESVAFSSHLPFSGSNIQASYFVESDSGDRPEHPGLGLEVVSPGYFETVGIEHVAGRDIAPSDGPETPLVAVVNRHFANLHWPGRSPLGERFSLDDSGADASWHEVVGVVGVTLKRGLDDEARPIAYFPRQQFYGTYGLISGRSGYITIRSASAPGGLVPIIRSEIGAIDPTLPLARIETGRELVAATTMGPRFRTILLSAFAAVALLVALVGVYGVIAFAISRRTREIGIRMALGASRGRILGQVLRTSTTMLASGLVMGIIGGLVAGRVLTSMLYEISGADPLSYVSAAALVVVTGTLACYLPARRAARIEPVEALRED